jgi:hypothetical protein
MAGVASGQTVSPAITRPHTSKSSSSPNFVPKAVAAARLRFLQKRVLRHGGHEDARKTPFV